MENHDINLIWQRAQLTLSRELTSTSYTNWVLPLRPQFVKDGAFVLQAADDLIKTTVEHRYLKYIIAAVKDACGEPLDVIVSLPENVLTGLSLSKAKRAQSLSRAGLNGKYVFENFVGGSGNEFALAASHAVAKEPGITNYNPLFLYGGVGLGKTHLMHSIGNYILNQDPEAKVLYTSAENLMNEFINSIREARNQAFRDKYRTVDVLLVDDIQFLLNKEGTQAEFFHTFNALHSNNKQIVISSDKPPGELKTLEARLTSRFGQGLLVDITAPDFETRTAILEKKAEMENFKIPGDIIRLIAKSISSNIRDLESALNKISAHAKLTNTQITTELAERVLREITNQQDRVVVTMDYIQDIVAQRHGITADEIRSRKRNANITTARHIAMYLSRKILDTPLTRIGEAFGGRDHSSVMYACDKIANDLEKREEMKELIIEMEEKISKSS